MNMKEDLADLKTKQAKVEAGLTKLEGASENAWQNTKQEVSNAYNSLEKSFNKVEDKFKQNNK